MLFNFIVNCLRIPQQSHINSSPTKIAMTYMFHDKSNIITCTIFSPSACRDRQVKL